MLRAAALGFVIAASAGCAASAGPRRVIVMDDITVGPSRQAIFIGDYDRALVSIAAVTEKELGLPRLHASLHCFPIARRSARSWNRRARRRPSRATRPP